jgi:hypothetical protein
MLIVLVCPRFRFEPYQTIETRSQLINQFA